MNEPQKIGTIWQGGEIDYTQSISQDVDGIITATLIFQQSYHKVCKICKDEVRHPDHNYLRKTNWGVQRLKGNLGRGTVTYKGVNEKYSRFKLKSATRSSPIETHPHFLYGKEIPKSADVIQNSKAYGYKFGEQILAGEPKGSRQAFYDTVDTNLQFKYFPKTSKFNLVGIKSYDQLAMTVQYIEVLPASDGYETSITTKNGGFAYQVGHITDLPDGVNINPKVLDIYPRQFSWMVTACNIDIIGGAMRQEVEFTLSGPKGWNRLIYPTVG